MCQFSYECISRFDISASGSVWPKYIGYFDLDWSNRYVACTCAVSSQWLLSVYEVLVAQLSGIGLTRPSAPAHTIRRISLLIRMLESVLRVTVDLASSGEDSCNYVMLHTRGSYILYVCVYLSISLGKCQWFSSWASLSPWVPETHSSRLPICLPICPLSCIWIWKHGNTSVQCCACILRRPTSRFV